jgi:hypothetical protein
MSTLLVMATAADAAAASCLETVIRSVVAEACDGFGRNRFERLSVSVEAGDGPAGPWFGGDCDQAIVSAAAAALAVVRCIPICEAKSQDDFFNLEAEPDAYLICGGQEKAVVVRSRRRAASEVGKRAARGP